MAKLKSIEILKDTHDVYDIEVENNHNFFANNILAHNCEIALRPYQFCNLCEVNVSDITSQEDLNQRVKAASFIGTLQASYTDFHYLRDIWKKTTEKDALLGVGMTGIGSGEILKYNLKQSADIAKEENARVSELIGINKAARVTTVKPSGCITPDTLIKTSVGSITIDKLFELNGYNLDDFKDKSTLFLPTTENIYVKDKDNEWQLISNLYVNGNQELINIEFEDGYIFRCTENHKLLTSNRGWVRADELTEEDDIISYE